MMVGHNPGLEELVEQLTGERQDLPTAALAQIVLPIDRWSDLKLSSRGTLSGYWEPGDLTSSALHNQRLVPDWNEFGQPSSAPRAWPAHLLAAECTLQPCRLTRKRRLTSPSFLRC